MLPRRDFQGLSEVAAKRVDEHVSQFVSPRPQISVVMSCYNAERWLAESIESVLAQTWRDFEFIIVDDGSTAETGEIIARFAEMDTRIVPISKPNSGLADSLNKGIARARGMWIARLDADDLCEPERLASQWRVASAKPALVFVGTGLVLIDESGTHLGIHRYPTSHRRLVAHLATARKFPAHSSALFRTEAFRRVGGYRSRIRRAQDRDLWLRLSEVGQLTSLQQPFVLIRKHASQISHEDAGVRQKVDSHVAMVSYWLRRRGHPDPVEFDATTYETFWMWVRARIADDGSFAHRSVVRGMNKAINRNSTSRVVRMIGLILSHPAVSWKHAWEYFLGSSLPRRLAFEWAQRSIGQMPPRQRRREGLTDAVRLGERREQDDPPDCRVSSGFSHR